MCGCAFHSMAMVFDSCVVHSSGKDEPVLGSKHLEPATFVLRVSDERQEVKIIQCWI